MIKEEYNITRQIRNQYDMNLYGFGIIASTKIWI